MRSVLFLLFFSAAAFAQLNSDSMRAKFGSPIHRETFRVPAGFEVVVDYGLDGLVCKLEVPASMPSDPESVTNTEVQKKRMTDFLAELVPASMRGKELKQTATVMSLTSLTSVEYEHVSISQIHSETQPALGNTIVFRFKHHSCSHLDAR